MDNLRGYSVKRLNDIINKSIDSDISDLKGQSMNVFKSTDNKKIRIVINSNIIGELEVSDFFIIYEWIKKNIDLPECILIFLPEQFEDYSTTFISALYLYNSTLKCSPTILGTYKNSKVHSIIHLMYSGLISALIQFDFFSIGTYNNIDENIIVWNSDKASSDKSDKFHIMSNTIPLIPISEGVDKYYFSEKLSTIITGSGLVVNPKDQYGTILENFRSYEGALENRRKKYIHMYLLKLRENLSLNMSSDEAPTEYQRGIEENFINSILEKPIYVLYLLVICLGEDTIKENYINIYKENHQEYDQNKKPNKTTYINSANGNDVKSYLKFLKSQLSVCTKIFNGTYELVKNTLEHTEDKRGILTAKCIPEVTLDKIKNSNTTFREYFKFLDEKKMLSLNYLDISIIDNGNVGIIEKTQNNLNSANWRDIPKEIKKKDLEILQTAISKFENDANGEGEFLYDLYFNPQKVLLTRQAISAFKSLGLLNFKKEIINNFGIFTVRTNKYKCKTETILLSSYSNNNNPDIRDSNYPVGTSYNIVVPICNKIIDSLDVEINSQTDLLRDNFSSYNEKQNEKCLEFPTNEKIILEKKENIDSEYPTLELNNGIIKYMLYDKKTDKDLILFMFIKHYSKVVIDSSKIFRSLSLLMLNNKNKNNIKSIIVKNLNTDIIESVVELYKQCYLSSQFDGVFIVLCNNDNHYIILGGNCEDEFNTFNTLASSIDLEKVLNCYKKVDLNSSEIKEISNKLHNNPLFANGALIDTTGFDRKKEYVKKYTAKYMPEDNSLIPFYKGINVFVSKTITKKTKKSKNDSFKIISDPILGYVNLSQMEVDIVDTELFQRLRSIKQLGLANYVYPSLNYSRFEHSLGVLGRLEKIIEHFSNKTKAAEKGNCGNVVKNINRDQNTYNTVMQQVSNFLIEIRLAALLHDIGHCLFSHSSERVMSTLKGNDSYPSSENLVKEFSEKFKPKWNKKIPISEILTVSIISSKSFKKFISKKYIGKKYLDSALENCCRFILGLPAAGNMETVFLGQLINGGLDVDKMDYMLREQHYSNIQLEIDMHRLISKLNVFKLKDDQLPKGLDFLKDQESETNPDYLVLGLSKGGEFAFEEFCIARLALYVKIYLHKKVRAIETQFEKCLRKISDVKIEYQEIHRWLDIPESILEYPDLYFKDTTQREVLRSIAKRDICSAVFGFRDRDLMNPEKDNTNHNQVNSNSVKQEIESEILKIQNWLKHSRCTIDFIIDTPTARFENIQQGHESLYFENYLLTDPLTIPTDMIDTYFNKNRALGYVFANENIINSAILSIAIEKVIFTKFERHYRQEGIISETIMDKVKKFKEQLATKEYYIDTPELKPISPKLTTVSAINTMKEIENKLIDFKSKKTNKRVRVDDISKFVNQFESTLQLSCLELLKNLKVVGYEGLSDIIEEATKFAKEVCKEEPIYYCPLGEITDSAAIMPYLNDEYFKKHYTSHISHVDFTKAKSIIFFDDNINSGTQLLSFFGDLLGYESEVKTKKRCTPLSSDECELMKKIPLYFCFIIGNTAVEKTLQDGLGKYGIPKDNIKVIIKEPLEDEDTKILSGKHSHFRKSNTDVETDKLKKYLSDIGEQLLNNKQVAKDRVETGKLGDGGAEAMIALPFNVPTMTITALREEGILNNGEKWIPLLHRKKNQAMDTENNENEV